VANPKDRDLFNIHIFGLLNLKNVWTFLCEFVKKKKCKILARKKKGEFLLGAPYVFLAPISFSFLLFCYINNRYYKNEKIEKHTP
jgi:hypothetical protein